VRHVKYSSAYISRSNIRLHLVCCRRPLSILKGSGPTGSESGFQSATACKIR
jgi:hypothetical protein